MVFSFQLLYSQQETNHTVIIEIKIQDKICYFQNDSNLIYYNDNQKKIKEGISARESEFRVGTTNLLFKNGSKLFR